MKDLKPKMGRFERHARKLKDQKALSNGTKKAVGISLNGSKMALYWYGFSELFKVVQCSITTFRA